MFLSSAQFIIIFCISTRHVSQLDPVHCYLVYQYTSCFSARPSSLLSCVSVHVMFLSSAQFIVILCISTRHVSQLGPVHCYLVYQYTSCFSARPSSLLSCVSVHVMFLSSGQFIVVLCISTRHVSQLGPVHCYLVYQYTSCFSARPSSLLSCVLEHVMFLSSAQFIVILCISTRHVSQLGPVHCYLVYQYTSCFSARPSSLLSCVLEHVMFLSSAQFIVILCISTRQVSQLGPVHCYLVYQYTSCFSARPSSLLSCVSVHVMFLSSAQFIVILCIRTRHVSQLGPVHCYLVYQYTSSFSARPSSLLSCVSVHVMFLSSAQFIVILCISTRHVSQLGPVHCYLVYQSTSSFSARPSLLLYYVSIHVKFLGSAQFIVVLCISTRHVSQLGPVHMLSCVSEHVMFLSSAQFIVVLCISTRHVSQLGPVHCYLVYQYTSCFSARPSSLLSCVSVHVKFLSSAQFIVILCIRTHHGSQLGPVHCYLVYQYTSSFSARPSSLLSCVSVDVMFLSSAQFIVILCIRARQVSQLDPVYCYLVSVSVHVKFLGSAQFIVVLCIRTRHVSQLGPVYCYLVYQYTSCFSARPSSLLSCVSEHVKFLSSTQFIVILCISTRHVALVA